MTDATDLVAIEAALRAPLALSATAIDGLEADCGADIAAARMAAIPTAATSSNCAA